MTKNEQLSCPFSGDWIDFYNHHNAENLSYGDYQLIEAHRTIMGSDISQILGTIRSRLQDFIFEVSDLPWEMPQTPPPESQINKIFQITINHAEEVRMSSSNHEHGDVYNVGQAGAVGKNAQASNNTFLQTNNEKKTLAEAAAEIQKLLSQLEREYPSVTEPEMISFVNDETTPSLKRRTSAALMACGEAAIDEFVLENKYLKVVKATVKGWLEAGQ